MATEPSALTGLFKEVYADDLLNLIPDASKLTKMVPFSQRDQTGNQYHQPVVVTQEGGVTAATSTAGAFALNAAIAMNTQDARIDGSQLLLRSALSYDAAAKASNSKKAFREATELLVTNMLESITKHVEIMSFYGGTAVNAGTGLAKATSSSNVSTTKTTLTIDAKTWAAGIWAGAENKKLHMYYDSSGLTLVSSSTDAIFTVSAVDNDNKKVTVTGTTTGISALDTRLTTDAVYPFFFGFKGNEFTGLNGIFRNTGSLFNIDASAYSLWASNVYSITGTLTMTKLLQGVGRAVNRGLDEDVVAFINPDAWADLNADQAATREYDQSYGGGARAENGFNELLYRGQNGLINVVSHNIVKRGDCFVFPKSRVKRIGAQDISFKTPGRGEDIFTQLADNAGYEMRVYTHQALLVEEPAKCVLITGFTPNT